MFRYLFLNRAPGIDWSPGQPERITRSLADEVTGALGKPRAGLGVGVSLVFSVFDAPPSTIADGLERLRNIAVETRTPILPVLDGQNWWGARPDLWNWWDPNQPGYDPRNAAHVEWTGPGPQFALKLAWRNWGRQIRVLPPPNLHAPRVRAALADELLRHAVPLGRWRRALPDDQKWLFPGIKVGWEASIGINAYTYPGANDYLKRDSSHDPAHGLDMAVDFAGGLEKQGWAALASEGRHAGPPTLADHERLVGDYLRFLARTVRRAGFPADSVFVHAGGQYAPWGKHYSHATAIGPDAVPGWSLYNVAPADAGDLGAVLTRNRRNLWCAAEWLTFAETAPGWEKALRDTLFWRGCRFVSLYNWEGIRHRPEALAGLRAAIAT